MIYFVIGSIKNLFPVRREKVYGDVEKGRAGALLKKDPAVPGKTALKNQEEDSSRR